MSGQAKLVYSIAEGETRDVLLRTTEDTTIGRHPSCTLTISQPSVSRRHARLYFEAGGYYLEDLKSSNGTFVNNQRITKASVTHGDDLRCGDFRFRYVEGDESGTRRQPMPAEMAAEPKVKAPRVVGTVRPRRGGSDRPNLRRSGPPGLPSQAPNTTGDVAPQAVPAAKPTRTEAPASSAELAGLRSELQTAQAAAERLRDDARMARKEAADAAEDSRARTARVQELEAEALRASEQIETLTDRSLRLREQVQAQQNQLEEYRREKVELELRVTEAQAAIGELEGAQLSAGSRENELADTVNDLKREVRQKTKAFKDVERQLDLAEYNLKAARDENENLRLALGDDDSRRKDLNATLTDLQQVLQEKEGMIDSLHADNQRLARELEQLAQGGEGHAQTQAQLEALQIELEEARRAVADRAAIASRQGVEQINQLKRDNRELRNRLSDLEASAADTPDASTLEARLFAAERERDAALAAQQEAESRFASKAAEVAKLRAEGGAPVPAPAPAPAADDTLFGEAVSNYEALNDLASALRMNVEVSVGYTQDLRPFIELGTAATVDTAALAAEAAATDVVFTLESLEEALRNAETGARDSKKAMRRFREALKARGYGS